MKIKLPPLLTKIVLGFVIIFGLAVLAGWLTSLFVKTDSSPAVSQARQDTVTLLNKDLAIYPQFGAPSSTLTIMVFGDFQCPATRKNFQVFRSIMSKNQQTVNFVWRDFPLASIHPEAELAAKAGICFQEQGKFWQYHDTVFANQNNLSAEFISNLVGSLGLDQEKYNSCLSNPNTKARVENDYLLGTILGVKGTPTFFINGVKVAGVVPEEAWQDLINKFLSQDKLK